MDAGVHHERPGRDDAAAPRSASAIEAAAVSAVTLPGVWLRMLDTRYTAWLDIGSKDPAGLWMNEMGPYFEDVLP